MVYLFQPFETDNEKQDWMLVFTPTANKASNFMKVQKASVPPQLYSSDTFGSMWIT